MQGIEEIISASTESGNSFFYKFAKREELC